jgi:hypothetical protein
MTKGAEGVSDGSAVFTGYEYAHSCFISVGKGRSVSCGLLKLEPGRFLVVAPIVGCLSSDFHPLDFL